MAKLRGLLLVHLLDLYLYLVRRLRLYTRLGLRLLHPRVVLLQLGANLLLLVSDLSLVLAVCVIALMLLHMLQAIDRVRRLLLDIDILILLRLSKQTLIELVEHRLLAGHRSFSFWISHPLIGMLARSLYQPVHSLPH